VTGVRISFIKNLLGFALPAVLHGKKDNTCFGYFSKKPFYFLIITTKPTSLLMFFYFPRGTSN
jgi:hypothetical protein